jgi:branched-chain amino acid transport system ATP-binding protein
VPLLEFKNITMAFGGLKAIDNLSFSIDQNQLVGLIGPNGAGKTTAFNTLTGVYQPTSGSLLFDGKHICNLKSHEISQAGIARTFQNIRLFKNLSVLDNVLIGYQSHVKSSLWEHVLLTRKRVAEEARLHDQAIELLSIFGLQNKIDEISCSLSYGEQRKLEIVRALATKPKLLLLDEPAAGMNHNETNSLMETIAQIRKQFNLTVLLIEHDMKLVMQLCEKIIVLDHGVKIEEGTPEHVRRSAQVIEAYLGAST